MKKFVFFIMNIAFIFGLVSLVFYFFEIFSFILYLGSPERSNKRDALDVLRYFLGHPVLFGASLFFMLIAIIKIIINKKNGLNPFKLPRVGVGR